LNPTLTFVGSLAGLRPVALDGAVGYFTSADDLLLVRLSDLAVLDSVRLPLPIPARSLARSSLCSRVLRLGVRCGVCWRNTVVLAVGGKLISARRVGDRLSDMRVEANLAKGRSALGLTGVDAFAGFDEGIYFGDYFPNPSRRPAALMHRSASGRWRQVFEFPAGEVNHIHSVVPDRTLGCLWVLTGDYGHSAGIWMARDNFSAVEPVFRGCQSVRACVAFPVRNGLLYASDSQLRPNSIRVLSMNGEGWAHRELHPVNGPVIYGARVGSWHVFSTATEPNQPSRSRVAALLDRKPGPGILRNESHVVIGTVEHGFRTVLTRVKDELPYRLFQFGHIAFPSGVSDCDRLFLYSVANQGASMTTEVFELRGECPQ